MSAAIIRKWGRIERGMPVMITPHELGRVTLRDFMDIAKETGFKIKVKRIRRGYYRLVVTS